MTGMNRVTGARLFGIGHIAQSIGHILSTPIGSRPRRRDYGSALFELVDHPMNPLGRMRVVAASADAIRRWEKRVRLNRILVAGGSAEQLGAGQFALELDGELLTARGITPFTRLSIPLFPATS